MARYLVTRRAFLQPDDSTAPRVCMPGEVISYSGPPGAAFVALDDDARAELAVARPTGMEGRLWDETRRRALADLSPAARRIIAAAVDAA